jgi:hypothetical protein
MRLRSSRNRKIAATSFAMKKPMRIGIRYCFMGAGNISYLILGSMKKKIIAITVNDQ